MTTLFDPSRPLVGSQPGYPMPRPLGAIPYIAVQPQSNGQVLLCTWLLTAPNNAGYFWHTCDLEDLAPLLARWVADPEITMRDVFGWPGAALPAAPARPTISLADLGL